MEDGKPLEIAAAYVRVSTDDQMEYSPDSQIEIIRAYAKQHGLILPEDFIFREEEGISGRKAERRPEFQRMIATAKQKPRPFTRVIVWKFSRFARNQEESIVYKSLLKKECGIEVVSVSEPIMEGPFGSLIERIIEWMDEYYSIRLSGEVKRGMTEKVKRGEPVSTPAFGYDIKDKQYIINPETAPLVRMIYQDFIAGMPYQAIARKLNGMGIRTKRGNLWENRTVEYILRNPVYIGKIRWNPQGKTRRNYADPNIKIVEGTHEHLIDQEIWEQAQARVAEIKAMYGAYSRPAAGVKNMLQGLVKCSTCGLTLSTTGNNGMQCIGYVHGKCNVSHFINTEKLTALVLSVMDADLDSGEIKLIKKETASPLGRGEADILEKQLIREKQKLVRIREAYEAGVDTLAEYKENKFKIMERIANLESRRQEPEAEETKESVQRYCAEQRGKLAKLQSPEISAAEKNTILRSFVDHIVFDRAAQQVEILYYK